MGAILKNGIRILTPREFDALHTAITKPDYKTLLTSALNTGMRYVELQRLQSRQEWLDPDRRCIHLPKEASRKKRRTMPDRYVYLCPPIVLQMQLFFKVRLLPRIQQWNTLLARWAIGAGIGKEGVSSKMTRKTWECWLAVSYPDRLAQIAMNQGHTQLVALQHYLQMPFDAQEKVEIRNRTAGWME